MSPTPGRPAVAPPPAEAVPDTAVDTPPPRIWPARRSPDRRPAAPGSRAEVRPWHSGPGPDVAVRLLDVSGIGIRVQLAQRVRKGQLFDVVLRDPAGRRCGRVLANARWSIVAPDGAVVAGLIFGHSLPAAFVERLSDGATIPDRATGEPVSPVGLG